MLFMNAITLILGIVGLVSIVALILVIILYKKLSRLTKGKNAMSLEKIISENNKLALEIKDKLKNQEIQIIDIKKDAMNNIQNIGVVRFNPFKETGGSQSFAVAMTDKKNNGVIISSLYTRDRVNVFAKPIIEGISEYKLTEEEQAAIKQSTN